MMFGLEYVMAGYFHLAATEPKVTCKVEKAPQFSVVATGMNYVVDHTKSITELTNGSGDAYNPYGAGSTTFTDGLMRGNIDSQVEFKWGVTNYPKIEKSTCLYVEKVIVKIHIDPTVYIAKEYKKDSCIYNAVMGHELKHIYTDRKVVNKYTTIIVRGLGAAFKKMGYAYGPVKDDQRDALAQKVSGMIQTIVQQYGVNMNAERDRLQQQVDTIQEYERVGKMCEQARASGAPSKGGKKN